MDKDIREIKGYNGYYIDIDGNLYKKLQYGRLKMRNKVQSGTTLSVNGKTVYSPIAKLVVQAFLDVNADDYNIEHIDGNRLNNNLHNLRLIPKQKDEMGITFDEMNERYDIKQIDGTDCFISSTGVIFKGKDGIYYKLNYSGNRFYIIIDKQQKCYVVSRLVYSKFVGDIPADYDIIHINNNLNDNRLENLRLTKSGRIYVIVKSVADNTIRRFGSMSKFYKYLVEQHNYSHTYDYFRKDIRRGYIRGYDYKILSSGYNNEGVSKNDS